MIVQRGRPPFKNAEGMSPEIRNFIEISTRMEPDERPTSQELLKVQQNHGINFFIFYFLLSIPS
jgi:hypothetical protein